MAALRVISADSHMLEPADLWVERLEKRFRDQAPRVIKNEGKPGISFIAPGIPPFPVAGGFGAGKKAEELPQHYQGGYENFRPSGWDPVERIKDQDLDGVEAEVLYPTLGMPLFALDDADLQRACFRVYNDWLAEFCAYNPKRLHGIALISLEDIQAGIKELERCANQGFKGAMIWGAPPADRPYSSRLYDPFWQAAQESETPVSLHVITGKGKGGSVQELKMDQVCSLYVGLIHEVQQSLTSIIFGGVLERFPRLKIVSAENDTGWIPHFMFRVDHAWEKFRYFEKEPLPLKPSEYIRRQLWATFQDDPVGPITYKLFGENNYMWASDFPHQDSTWPESRKVIDRDFASVPQETTRKIVFDNAAKLYRIDLN